MEPRQQISVALVNLGDGQVILDLPEESLLPPERNVAAPSTPQALDTRLYNGVATVRPGQGDAMTQTKQDLAIDVAHRTDAVTGLFHAVFNDDTDRGIRATKDSIYSFIFAGTPPTPGFSDISPTGNELSAIGDTDFWSFAMVRRASAGTDATNQLFAVNGLNGASAAQSEILRWDPSEVSGMVRVTDVGPGGLEPLGAKVIVSFLNRAFAMNILDEANPTTRRNTRIAFSIVGDPQNWSDLGSGTVDLNVDPYPIVAAAVMSGGLVIFKGGNLGGSIWRGTPTGLAANPVRYDAMNPGTGVGLLARRTLLIINPGMAFMLAHDGFYLYDGVRALRKVMAGHTRSILSRINYSALDAAHSWYVTESQEVHTAIPTGSSSTPNEVWVYHIPSDRTYGPYKYNADIITQVPMAVSGATDWTNGMDFSGGWGTIPFDTWSSIGGSLAGRRQLYGLANGLILEAMNNVGSTDDGVAITAVYETPIINAEERVIIDNQNQPQRLLNTDMLTLHRFDIRYRSSEDWTPTVNISTNGGATYTKISSDATFTASGGEIKTAVFYPGVPITALTFKAQVRATAMNMMAVIFRFTFGGDSLA